MAAATEDDAEEARRAVAFALLLSLAIPYQCAAVRMFCCNNFIKKNYDTINFMYRRAVVCKITTTPTVAVVINIIIIL